MIEINIEEVMALQNRRREINSTPLKEIIFKKDGHPINIPPELLEEFRFTGLNNVDFIDMGFYEQTAESITTFIEGE
jgi:hypothetical protein